MDKKYIFIIWDADEFADLHHEYIGGGEYKVVGTPIVVTHRVLYSSEVSPAMVKRAEQYAADDMNDKRNVRVIIGEW